MIEFNYNEGMNLLRVQKNNLGDLIDLLHSAKVELTNTEEFLETHLLNYYFQLTSLDLLISGTKVFPANNNKFFDLSSIYVLIRSVIENYFNLHYLYFEPTKESDQAYFRYYLYNINGLNIRQNMQIDLKPPPAVEEKLKGEKIILVNYIELLKDNSYFKTLSDKKQKQLLQTKPAREVSFTSLSRLYFQGDMFRLTWKLLSNYAHSEFIGALQLKSIFKDPGLLKEMPSLLRQPLFAVIMMNASLFFQLNKRFKSAEIIYEGWSRTFKENNKAWYDVSQKLS